MCENCHCGSNVGCDCGCGDSCDCHHHESETHFSRRYQTKAEQIDELERYLSELKTEVQAVEERLTDLKK